MDAVTVATVGMLTVAHHATTLPSRTTLPGSRKIESNRHVWEWTLRDPGRQIALCGSGGSADPATG
jgi:hypothetical protein